MSNPLATQLGTTATVIAALTPTTAGSPSSTFVAVPGELAVEDEPEVMDRAFDVGTDDSGGKEGEQWGTSYAERFDRMVVAVRYDARADLSACDGRMQEDSDQIVSAVTAGGNRATDVRLITYAGRTIDRSRKTFPILKLAFDVRYIVAL